MRVAAQLSAVDEATALRRPAPDKWSIKEIVGHLIDSAANNHGRFVRAVLQEDLVFPGYAQVEWVVAQHYQDAPWPALALLWRDYNLHLARVMEAMPVEPRMRARAVHNLHEIAFNPVPRTEPASLDYFMRDYVDHLQHHVRQVEALLGVRVGKE
jgi:DinB family protein